MSQLAEHDALEVKVANFGPIVEAVVDFASADGIRRAEQYG